MKNLITATLALTALAIAPLGQSATIAGVQGVTLLNSSTATVSASDAHFTTISTNLSQGGTGTTFQAADSAIAGALTDTTSNLLATNVLNSFASSTAGSDAYIDISFGESITGADDLIFYFIGGNEADGSFSTSFGLDIDLDGNIDTNNSITNFIPTDNGLATKVLDLDQARYGIYNYYTVTAATIDLSAAGLASDAELDNFRIYFGNDTTRLSAVGHIAGLPAPSPAAVPLPLPIVLFASGLGMLGWFGRRKSL